MVLKVLSYFTLNIVNKKPRVNIVLLIKNFKIRLSKKSTVVILTLIL